MSCILFAAHFDIYHVVARKINKITVQPIEINRYNRSFTNDNKITSNKLMGYHLVVVFCFLTTIKNKAEIWGIYMFRFVCCTLISLIFISSASANCSQLEQQTRTKVENLQARMQGASGCTSTKLLIQVLELNLQYFEKCPSADPSGTTKTGVINALNQTNQSKNALCG